MGKPLLYAVLALLLCGCKGEKSDNAGDPKPEAKEVSEAGEKEPQAAKPPADAGKPATADDAAVVLQRFAKNLLGNSLDEAKEDLQIPPSFESKQVDFFLSELQAPKNLSLAGVEAIIEAEFGSLQERFGSQAEHVAKTLSLPLESLYAFGDTSAAALFVWDGEVFRVVAVHKLAAP